MQIVQKKIFLDFFGLIDSWGPVGEPNLRKTPFVAYFLSINFA